MQWVYLKPVVPFLFGLVAGYRGSLKHIYILDRKRNLLERERERERVHRKRIRYPYKKKEEEIM